MAGIQPSKLRINNGLLDEVSRFKQLLSQDGARMIGIIFSVTKSTSGHSKFVVSLDSLEVRRAGTVDLWKVKQVLLKSKLAETDVESFLSQQDHRERMRYTAYNQYGIMVLVFA